MLLPFVYSVTLVVVAIAMIYMAHEYRGVKAMDEGTEAMSKLARRIRSGSKVFTIAIYKRVIVVAAILAFVLCLFVERYAGLAFLGGLLCTTISVIVGMSVATYANVRAAAVALKNMNEKPSIAGARTVNATIRASKICGIIVHSTVLLGLTLTALISGVDPSATSSSIIPMQKAVVVPIVARLTAYSLGWSVVAMFCRVAGGIFTKAADIGADLIGKVFMHFDEDDPRNPAVLADFVGDNVNDIDGNQADLGESFAATPVTAIITAVNMYGPLHNPVLLAALIAYPFILALGGLVSSIIGLHHASNAKESENPAKQINISMGISAIGSLLTSLFASFVLFRGGNLPAEFESWTAPFLSTVFGIIAGVSVGFIAQYFTDLESKWAIRTSEMATRGSALCISTSNIAGWISCFFEVAVVALLSYAAYMVAGPYGQAVMALGMLSFVAQPISADAFGPISDNAGGIAESCGLPEKVREITDANDAYGNSSAAVGKGFAIGSAAAVVLSQISTFLRAYGQTTLDVSKGNVMMGLLIGGGLVATFCGLLGYYTLIAAGEMADECRKQLSDQDVVSGKKEPDSNQCIKIATENALGKMVVPVLIAVLSTLVIGFVFGPDTMGGTLTGVMVVGLPLAIYFSNAGGLADNAKKRFEANLVSGYEKGTESYNPAHDAATHGDTMGDWMKDVVAVCIDIFMKIMGTLAIMLAPLFAAYCLLPLA